MEAPYVSLVIPVMNEIENVRPLYDALVKAIEAIGRPTEMVLVDDGSTDGTVESLEEIAAEDPRLKLIVLRRNYGQTAAMKAGIDFASGEITVTLDGDLQNDPSDIPMMIEHIENGYDLVHGWRRNRQDTFLTRKLPSRCANWLISRSTGFPIHDLGCTLKAIRADIAKELELYGEMHRFIPILAHMRGARCIEVVTKHHARVAGQTKYGLGRTFRVVLDLMTVSYLQRYFASPMKLFGMVGLLSAMISVAAGLGAGAMKLFASVDLTGNPLLWLTMLAGIASIQFFSLGLLGEVNARIYYAQEGRRNYTVRRTLNYGLAPRVLNTEPSRSKAA